jgi:hypothetical protein
MDRCVHFLGETSTTRKPRTLPRFEGPPQERVDDWQRQSNWSQPPPRSVRIRSQPPLVQKTELSHTLVAEFPYNPRT